MEKLLKYRENSYFNDKDYFLLLDVGLNKFYLTDIENINGSWFVKEYRGYGFKRFENNDFSYDFKHNKNSLIYKMTSVLSINLNELIGLKVKYLNTELIGAISKGVLNNLGVQWDDKLSQDDFKKYGFPYFWNELKFLNVI